MSWMISQPFDAKFNGTATNQVSIFNQWELRWNSSTKSLLLVCDLFLIGLCNMAVYPAFFCDNCLLCLAPRLKTVRALLQHADAALPPLTDLAFSLGCPHVKLGIRDKPIKKRKGCGGTYCTCYFTLSLDSRGQPHVYPRFGEVRTHRYARGNNQQPSLVAL
jgi:hypothetical protein